MESHAKYIPTYGHFPLMLSINSLIARTWLHANSTRDASSMPSLINVNGMSVPPSCDSAQP